MPVVTRSQSHAAQIGNPQPTISGSAFTSVQTPAFAPPAPALAVPAVPAAAPEPPAPPAHLPHEHLRRYVQSAKIQKIKFRRNHPVIRRGRERVTPPNSHLLSIEPDSRFRLREIWISRPPSMADRVLEMIRKEVPSQPIQNAESRGVYIRTANFSLPAQGFWTFIDPPPEVDSAITLAKCTMQLLETAERVVNLVWPEESKGLAFTFPTDSPIPEADAAIIAPLYYQKVREQDLVSITEPKVKVVVMVVAPWALAHADMQDMLIQGKFPAFQMKPDGTRPKFTRTQKVWAQIYECCASQNCPFFVLTTHDHWIFGSFHTASGWSRAVCTTIMDYTASRPSILEWVIFWCASALKLEGGWCPGKFSSTYNPEIAHPDHLQIAYTDPAMAPRDWLLTYLESWDFRTVSATTKIDEHPNCYITKF